MKALDYLLIRLGLKSEMGPRYFELDETLQTKLLELAGQEGRPAEEIHTEILEAGLTQRKAKKELLKRWESLSTREQQVTAFTCLGYTNRQIGVRLGISEDTVKTHMRNLLAKFNLHGKDGLRQTLSGWDFSGWEK